MRPTALARLIAALYALAIAAVPVALAQPATSPDTPAPVRETGGGVPWFLILLVALVVVWFIARRGSGRRTLPPPRAP